MDKQEKFETGSEGGASGDYVKPELSKSSSVRIPPPDVELFIDGFGFMPSKVSHFHEAESRESEVFNKSDPTAGCTSSCDNNIVRRYTWKTRNRMTVQVITYGATITLVSVPDRKGTPEDVIAGFDTLEEYMSSDNPYFGGLVGRCANYVKEGTMHIRPSGKLYMLTLNKSPHHYNGGHVGFDKVNWRSHVDGLKVIMTHVSIAGTEGYPGTLMAEVTFEVTVDNTLRITKKCTTSEPTIANLSHMLYFNLAGHHSGPEEMLQHIVTLNGDKYTAVDEENNITGQKRVVGGTMYDLRVPRRLCELLPKMPQGGYDTNFCVTRGVSQDLTFVSRVLHPNTGRVLEFYSNQPGVQFYTGQMLPDPGKIVEMENKDYGMNEAEDAGCESETASNVSGVVGVGYKPLIGKHGAQYTKHGLIMLASQNYPDAVNQPHFPSPVLNPGEVYIHKVQIKFGLLLGKYS